MTGEPADTPVRTSGAVTVVLRDHPSAAQQAALDAQTHPVGPPVVAAASWHDAVARAGACDTEWLWLVDPDVEPAPTALERLLAGAGEATDDLPAPVLLASKVVRPDGRLDASRAPWPPLLDRVVVIAAARRRLVSLRMARWGSLLVRRDVVDELGPPRADLDGGADDLDWTARILRERAGYLVPASVATRNGPEAGLTPAEARGRAAMVRGDAWVAQEPVWFAFMLAVDVIRAGRERPARLPRLLAGVARGARDDG